MTKYLQDKTSIPNWVMSIILVTLVSVFGLGWQKVDTLDKRLIVNETKAQYEQRRLQNLQDNLKEIDVKLDLVVEKIIKMERRSAKD